MADTLLRIGKGLEKQTPLENDWKELNLEIIKVVN
jgi:hypothetical protein